MHAPSELAGLAELSGVRMLWFSDWYDGPVTGLAAHGGHEYWFSMVANEGAKTWDFDPRVYILHRLTPEQLAVEWERHRCFAALDVPGCLHKPPCPVSDSPRAGELAELYRRWPPGDDKNYDDAPAIGWFIGSASAPT